MSISEIKSKLEKAYNEEDWNLIEDLIDVLDTIITLGVDDYEDEWDDDEIDQIWGCIGIRQLSQMIKCNGV